MEIFAHERPQHVHKLREYFEASVAAYAKDHSIDISPKEFGFDE